MDYIKMICGIALLVGFGWILAKNTRRTGFLNSLFRIDTVIGIIAGLYLILTSASTLWA